MVSSSDREGFDKYLAEFESHLLERSCREFKESSEPPSCDATSISKVLIPHVPPRLMPTKNKKSSGLVLTSEDSIRKMQEREQKRKIKLSKRKRRNDSNKRRNNNSMSSLMSGYGSLVRIQSVIIVQI